MVVITSTINFADRGENDIVDITQDIEAQIKDSGLNKGICNVFVAGATGGIIAIEFEPGLIKDFPALLERIAPKDINYAHHMTWGDYNGHSHVRASLIGPSMTIPFKNGKLIHGTWQQFVFYEFDTRRRNRTLYLTIMGE
ncbi:MAG: YjbQ family protein [Candidatus Helarchaeota archaeon]|nr:YjbQ family protein [Candidatus Helarchaeota archaeon]